MGEKGAARALFLPDEDDGGQGHGVPTVDGRELSEGGLAALFVKESITARHRGVHTATTGTSDGSADAVTIQSTVACYSGQLGESAHRRSWSGNLHAARDSWRQQDESFRHPEASRHTEALRHSNSASTNRLSLGGDQSRNDQPRNDQSRNVRDSRNGVLLKHRFCPWDGTEFRPLSDTCSVCGDSRTHSRYSGTNDKVLALLLKPPWERVLWKRQPYDDNFVDRSFLESLVTNANFYTYDVGQIMKDSIVVTQHLAGTALFLAFTYLTNYQALEGSYLLALDVALALVGGAAMLLVWVYSSWTSTLTGNSAAAPSGPFSFLMKTLRTQFLDEIGGWLLVYVRPAILFVAALWTLSPVLRTLTMTISGDTLAAWSSLLLTVNIFCHDYRWVNGHGTSFQGSVSLNAAMFMSVMLASRAPSNMHVALIMCSAVEVFALAPRVYRTVKGMSDGGHASLAALLTCFALVLLFSMNKALGVLFGVTVLFVSVVCPLTFLYIQRYKNKINGPWDEAVPTRPNDKMGGGLNTSQPPAA